MNEQQGRTEAERMDGWMLGDWARFLRGNVYLMGFLSALVGLLFVGRDQLPSSTLLIWGLTFGGTTAVAVLLVSLYRVRVELKESRHELATKAAELNFAREVQTAIFPTEFPRDTGLSFSAVCKPAQGISGDFYDIFRCPDGRIVVAVADVSGKGVSAAILMANLQARLRVHAERNADLSEVSYTLNNDLYAVTEQAKFATAFVAQWHPELRRLDYVNAGHSTPVLLSSANSGELNRGGTPFGMFPGVAYEFGNVELRTSDVLVLYSDGITEAAGSDGEEFGFGRLIEVVTNSRSKSTEETRESILTAVEQWAGREQDDDMTLVVVKVEKQQSEDSSS
ncbi:MAG TPA: PP2C family protein-serine/threonine phosphatase [Acidobacteriota bacterium]|nr:PP2C family protein-serine/threonine phosphatase [Acidobacteriota bacterium]